VKTAASLVSAGTERMLVEFAEKSLLGKGACADLGNARYLIKPAGKVSLSTVEGLSTAWTSPCHWVIHQQVWWRQWEMDWRT
jgi:hypothetical protein